MIVDPSRTQTEIRSSAVSDQSNAPLPPYVALIVDPDPVWRQNAQRTISAYAATVELRDLEDAQSKLASSPANIMVFGPNSDVNLKDHIGPILRRMPHIGVLLVMDSVALDINGMRNALRAGVREVLPSTANPDEIQMAVGRITDLVSPLPANPVTPAPAPQVTRTQGKRTKRDRGRLVMVCSAKGGTGVSTVAMNLAAALVAEGRTVSLCDADPVFGDLPLLMGIKPRDEIEPGDLPKQLKPEEVIEELVTHKPTGVQFFGMYRAHIPLHDLSRELILAVAEGLQAASEIVIIDLPAPLVNIAEYLVAADELFFVAGTDVASLKNLRLARKLIADAGLPLSKSWMILNRVRNISDFEASSYNQIVGIPVVCAIPDSPAVIAAGDNKQVIVQSSPKDPVSRAIIKFAQDLGGRFDEIDAGGMP